MNQDQTIDLLCAHGFQPRATVSRKWRGALWYRQGSTTLLVLFRSGGVDLLHTPLTPDEIADVRGRLRVRRDGSARLCEFFYGGSGCNVHHTVVEEALRFSETGTLSVSLLPKTGLSRGDIARQIQVETGDQELFEAASPDGRSPAYLGDGVWLHAGGRSGDRSPSEPLLG